MATFTASLGSAGWFPTGNALLGAALVSRETPYTIIIKLRKLPDALKADQTA